MKTKSILIILGVLITLVLLIFLISRNKNQDRPFNPVVLSDNNLVLALSQYSVYDTILRVGLDEASINGVTINIRPLTSEAKSSFDGELKAHIKLHDNIYYLFVDDNYSRVEAVRILSHEIIHIEQYESKRLTYDENSGVLTWEGSIIDLNTLPYDNRPWENEAFQKEKDLSTKIEKVVYGK